MLKNSFLIFLANFFFVVSHLKIHPAIHLKNLKSSDVVVVIKKSFLQFTSFRYSYVLTCVKNRQNGSREPECTNRADKNSNIITLVAIMMLL